MPHKSQRIQDFQQRRLPCRRFAGVGAHSAQNLDLLSPLNSSRPLYLSVPRYPFSDPAIKPRIK
jgi:hypothetical protein